MTRYWNVEGSRLRDRFRLLHKQRLGHGDWYATDGDLFMVSHKPPGLVALLEIKGPDDDMTDTEKILFRWCDQHGVDFYLLDIANVEEGKMRICAGLECYFVQSIRNWNEYAAWERSVRNEWRRLHLASAEMGGDA